MKLIWRIMCANSAIWDLCGGGQQVAAHEEHLKLVTEGPVPFRIQAAFVK